MAVIKQPSGDGSLGEDMGAKFFRVDVKAAPPKLPGSLDFNFWKALVFLPEGRFVGGDNVNEVGEGGFRHIEFQMSYIRGQKLELSSLIRQASMRLRGGN
jgi:hypothetical protein